MSTMAVLLWAVVACLVLSVAGIFAALVLMGRIDAFPQEGQDSDQAQSSAGVIDTSYEVLVLNATATSGLDAAVRDLVIAQGWAEDRVIYGAAGSQDLEESVLYYATDEDLAAAQGLASALNVSTVEQSDFYVDPTNPDEKELVVVLGADLAASVTVPEVAPEPTETPAP